MTVAPTDFREAHQRVWALIESGLESNSSWREKFVDYGLLATVGFDQPFDGDDDKVGELAEQLNLSADVVVGELRYFIRQNCLWSTDELVADMDRALKVLVTNGSPEEVVDCLLDFSPYAKRPDVLRALRTAATKRDDAEAFQSILSEFEQ
ncbi:hypothetical protein [Synechococcus sp. UW179A]|uniref:hypothetical protein n=1 Tax=Synechococcus sp. UW179A TaxID=2575510 RepID=UPI000E0ECCEB|nr:hypothetical protein [Synechococcus sp. UW179A]